MAVVTDHDRDSLHVLPLSIVPLETPVLQKTRMIKNTHLESVIEMFDGKDTGSGQVKIEALGMVFDSVPYADLNTLNKLARLNSYDVYSLRILLRKQGVDVDAGELRLSDTKQKQLTNHMRSFTRPLINFIYGDDRKIDNFADAIALLSHPDVKMARQKLISLSDRLGIPLEQVPKFLEDYGDIFLSISYFRDCMGSVAPTLKGFHTSVDEICENRLLQQDRNLMDTCLRVRGVFVDLSQSINQRFRAFEIGSKSIWDEIDAARFHKFRELVQNNQTMMGGVLCGMSLKMQAWNEQFPDERFGGPMKRAEFIMNEMQQGLDKYRRPGVRPRASNSNSRPQAKPASEARMWSRSAAF
jgi:hypothetical protein